MMNKPAGYLCARTDLRHKTVMELLDPTLCHLYPVGRLDKDTEGLLLLTDDGRFFHRMCHPAHAVEKTYFFYSLGTVTESMKHALTTGVPLPGGMISRPARFAAGEVCSVGDILPLLCDADARAFRQRRSLPVFGGTLTISEGKKHQVKRMLLAVGGRVLYLKRLSVGGVRLDPSLRPGEYRPLSDEEIHCLI